MLCVMTDSAQPYMEINCDLLQREIVCPELRCCYPSLKWEVPVTKSSTEDIFRPFLKRLRIDKMQTSGRRLGPPEIAPCISFDGVQLSFP